MKRVAMLLQGLFIIVVLGYFAYAVWGPTRTIGLRAPVRQDDFVYTVIDVYRARALGPIELPRPRQVVPACLPPSAQTVTGCDFWVVSINVENQARQVPYTWDPSIVFLESEDRKQRAPHDPEGQRAFDAQNEVDRVLPPGTARTFGVVFRVGASLRRALLGYSNGMLMGDLFNGMAYSRVRVLLEPPRAFRARVAP